MAFYDDIFGRPKKRKMSASAKMKKGMALIRSAKQTMRKSGGYGKRRYY